MKGNNTSLPKGQHGKLLNKFYNARNLQAKRRMFWQISQIANDHMAQLQIRGEKNVLGNMCMCKYCSQDQTNTLS